MSTVVGSGAGDTTATGGGTATGGFATGAGSGFTGTAGTAGAIVCGGGAAFDAAFDPPSATPMSGIGPGPPRRTQPPWRRRSRPADTPTSG